MNRYLKPLIIIALVTLAGIAIFVILHATFSYVLAPILETYVFPPPEPHTEGLGIISLSSNFGRAVVSFVIFYLFSVFTASFVAGFLLRRGGHNAWHSLISGLIIGSCYPFYQSFVVFDSLSLGNFVLGLPGALGSLIGYYVASRKYRRRVSE